LEKSGILDSCPLSQRETARVREKTALVPVLSLILLVFNACLAASPVSDVSTAFDAANKLYAQGRFADAAGAYQNLIDSGPASPALYFNLGNALFKSGQIGRAIAVYRHAEELSPHDPDLRANLQFARNNVQGPTFLSSRWERVLNRLSLNEWTWASVAGVWVTFLLLAARQLWPKAKRSLKNWTILVGVAAIGLSGCLGCALAHRTSVRIVVVTADELTVRAAPFDESPNVFVAHDGAEFRVLDQKDSWLQVTDGTRRVGWLKRADVTWQETARLL
jgi:tetratricopeptide (TPR) repeat protein